MLFPQYTPQPHIALDISDSSLEALALARRLGRPGVFGYNRMVIPQGVISDGVIARPMVLTELISRLVSGARPHPLKQRSCIISLPDSQVFTQVVRIPRSLGKESLKHAVLHQVQKSFPIGIQNVYYDFVVIHDDGHFFEILFAAALKTTVHSYVEVLNSAGLIPVALDVECSSIGRALLLPADEHYTTLILDIGARDTNANLYKKNILAGAHTIPLGGDTMTQKIAQAMQLSFKKAASKKEHIGFTDEKSPVTRICIEVTREIIHEVKKIIQQHWYKEKTFADQILLAGGGALLPGVEKFIQSHFRQEVHVRNPLKKLSLRSAEYLNGRAILFSNVVGLGLKGLSLQPWHESLNLLHKVSSDIQIRQTRKKVKV